jgi:hypothetical protein
MADTAPLFTPPQGEHVRTYASLDEYDYIKKRLVANNTPFTEGIDIVSALPAISANENGVPVYYRALNSLVLLGMAALSLLRPKPEEMAFRRDSNITFDKEYVRTGDTVTIRIELVGQAISDCELTIETIAGEKECRVGVDYFIDKKITLSSWKPSNQGVFRARLSGKRGNRAVEISSSLVVDVLDPEKYSVGTFLREATEIEEIAVEELASAPFAAEADFAPAVKTMLFAALCDFPQSTCVIVKDTQTPGAANGTARLIRLTFTLYQDIIDTGDSTRLKVPAYAYLQKLHDHGVTFDRIITSDSLQLVPGASAWQWAHHEPDSVKLGKGDLNLYVGSGRVPALPDAFSSAIHDSDLVLHAPQTLSSYLYITTKLNRAGVLMRPRQYRDALTVLVHPRTIRQRYLWIAFDDDTPAASDEATLSAATSQGDDGACIVSPLLTSAAVLHQSRSFTAYIDVPLSCVPSGTDVRQMLESRLYLDVPLDQLHPFKGAAATRSASAVALTIAAIELVAADPFEQFFGGTMGRESQQASYMRDPSEELSTKPVGTVHYGMAENLMYVPPDLREYARRVYYRAYPGLLAQCKSLYKVTLLPASKPAPGMYLLRMEGVDDGKVHPVKIIDDAQKQVTVAHFTDLHLAARYDEVGRYIPAVRRAAYVNPNAMVRKLAARLNAADFVVVTGDAIDFVNDHRPWEPGFVPDRNWRYLSRLIKDCFTVPVFIVPGNHDYRINPFPPSVYSQDLNATGNDLDRYPFDGSANYPGWLRSRCAGDLFFADENGLQYFYYQFCPFRHFGFTLGNMDFVFLDSEHDEVVFLSDYAFKETGKGLDYLLALFGTNPPPRSSGLSDKALSFVEAFVSHTGALFMHSAVKNPPIGFPDPLLYEQSLRTLDGWERPYLPDPVLDLAEVQKLREKIQKKINQLRIDMNSRPDQAFSNGFDFETQSDINYLEGILSIYAMFTGSKRACDEACIARNKDRLIALLSKATPAGGTVRYVVSGHVHKNLELKYKLVDKGFRWFMGRYSRAKAADPPPPLEQCAYAIATVSGSVVGYRWEPKWPGAEESPSTAAYKRTYHGLGYRLLRFTLDGALVSMDVTEFDKKGLGSL